MNLIHCKRCNFHQGHRITGKLGYVACDLKGECYTYPMCLSPKTTSWNVACPIEYRQPVASR